MREDIFARMSEDTRALMQQMQEHGFFQMGEVITSGRVAIAEVAVYLRLRFNLVS